MSRIFIDRPIFAWVLAIIVMLAGHRRADRAADRAISRHRPDQRQHPGQLSRALGRDGREQRDPDPRAAAHRARRLLYFSATSSSRGQARITATFDKSVDPDIAQVQVQNKIQAAISRLPAEVQQQGVRVTKSNADALLMVAVYDTTGTRNYVDIADYLASNIQDPLSRIPGVGDVNVFGSPHAMRVWLDPQKLAAFALMPGDVVDAIRTQNAEVAAATSAACPRRRGRCCRRRSPRSRSCRPRAVRRHRPQDPAERLERADQDVARVEIGAEQYNVIMRMSGYPARACRSRSRRRRRAAHRRPGQGEDGELGRNLPDGIAYAYANDSPRSSAVGERGAEGAARGGGAGRAGDVRVPAELARAAGPTVAVPVVLLGTLAVFYVAGFSINTLTLFGLVLAIGLLVDDAIVVVENVERLMEENPGMTAREATIKSMGELQTALVAIALVLSAVFMPMAFFGGSTGVIYRQFSLTIISCMTLSVLVALILSPAITANVLKPRSHGERTEFHPHSGRFAGVANVVEKGKVWFNRTFDRLVLRYVAAVRTVVDRKWRFIGLYALIVVLLALLFWRLPGGFIPARTRAGADPVAPARRRTQTRSIEVRNEIEKYLSTYEKANAEFYFLVAGGGGGGGGVAGQNTGQGFVNLKHWDERPGAENTADAIAERATGAFRNLRDAQVFVLVPGSVQGLGDTLGLQHAASRTRAG
jgi:multidrug efflux pump